MTRVVVRLLTSILLIPAIVVGTVIIGVMLEQTMRRRISEDTLFTTCFIMASLTYCTLFYFIWRSVVRWTPSRKRWTIVSIVIAAGAYVLVALMLASAMPFYQSSPFIALSAGLTALVWACASCWIWMETPRERFERVRTFGESARTCPACKYDMSGLKNLTCPECGVDYTVETWTREQMSRAASPNIDV
jgi:hypothetical protein